MANQIALTDDQIRRSAPSVFASSPWHDRSERYRFVPTIEVVDLLRGEGFQPVQASQSRSRIEGKGEFTRHMLRFRHRDHLGPAVVGEQVSEVVLVNSHDGTSAYQLHAGIFRFVCTNGMVVASSDAGSISVHHKGGSDFRNQIIDATYQIASETPKTLEKIEQWRKITLEAPHQDRLARAALTLRKHETLKPHQLLAPKRAEDAPAEDGSRSLWSTFNCIQEHVVKGGDPVLSAAGRRSRTRPIKSVSEDLRLNRALWEVAEHAAKLWG